MTDAERILELEYIYKDTGILPVTAEGEVLKLAPQVARENIELRAKLEKAEKAIHEAKEVYVGMDGFVPETAPEGYQQRILREMYKALQDYKQE